MGCVRHVRGVYASREARDAGSGTNQITQPCIAILPYISPCPVFRVSAESGRHPARIYMVPLGKERAPAPSTTSSAAEDAAPAQHSRRRAGVIRQAQPEAPGHQLAASHAAAEKRKANKMTPMERRAKRAADEKRRWHEKRKATREAAAKFSMASEDTEKDPAMVIASLLDELVAEVAEVAEVRDEVDEGELQEELEKLLIARCGSPLLEDTGTREALELRADGYGAARGDDGPQVYRLPFNELQRRVADSEDAWPGEAQMAWDQRVIDARAACTRRASRRLPPGAAAAAERPTARFNCHPRARELWQQAH